MKGWEVSQEHGWKCARVHTQRKEQVDSGKKIMTDILYITIWLTTLVTHTQTHRAKMSHSHCDTTLTVYRAVFKRRKVGNVFKDRGLFNLTYIFAEISSIVIYPWRSRSYWGKYLKHSWPVGVQLSWINPPVVYVKAERTEITNMSGQHWFSLIASGFKHRA